MINHEAVEALSAVIERLQTAMDALAAKTGKHSFKECHDAMEEQRQAFDDARLMPAGPAQERQLKQAQGTIDRATVEQQMGGHNFLGLLFERLSHIVAEAHDMAAAVEEAAK
jgi:hypothetical protein